MPTLQLWPLPALADGRLPVISSGFGPRPIVRAGKRVMVTHAGADMTYEARPCDPPARVVGGKVVYTLARTKHYYSPADVVVYAADDGEVVGYRMRPGIGGDVWLHHKGLGLVTRYAHLASLRSELKVGARVTAGYPLGIMGAGSGRFRHLHFAVLRAGQPGSYMDPARFLDGAKVFDAQRRRIDRTRPNAAVARGRGGGKVWPWLMLALAIGATKSTTS